MTSCSDRMQKLVLQVDGQLLAPAGYQRFGWTWNQTNDAGFTYVINLQSSLDDQGDNCLFTINLGVHVPQINRFNDRIEQRGHVQEMECDFRERLGMLIDGQDVWWPVAHDVCQITDEFADYLLPIANDWFAQFADGDAILDTWIQSRESSMPSYPDFDLCVAVLLAKMGQPERSRELFLQLIQEAQSDDPVGYFADASEQNELNMLLKGLDLL